MGGLRGNISWYKAPDVTVIKCGARVTSGSMASVRNSTFFLLYITAVAALTYICVSTDLFLDGGRPFSQTYL